jgi:hypothetical protein
MTSYCPQTKFSTDPLGRWNGGESVRYATPEEAQASLAPIIETRQDLIETRIVESRYKPTHVWRFDKGGSESRAPPQYDHAQRGVRYRK